MDSRHLLSGAALKVLAGLGFALFARVNPASATFAVSNWELASIAHNSATGQDSIQASYTVENPFIQNQLALIGPTLFSEADYSLSWDNSGGSFHIDISQQALDPPPGGAFGRSAGFIFIQSSFDAVLTVTGTYNYSLPPDEFSADLLASVRDTVTNQTLWSQSPDANSYGGSFVSGTLNVGTPPSGILLTGGHTHRLRYDFLLNTFGGGTTAIGMADGSIQWTITVLPEISSVAMLIPAGMMILLRRGTRWRG